MKIFIIFLLFSGLKEILKEELERNFFYLKENFEVKPYFILYRINKIDLYYLEYSKDKITHERKVSFATPYVELRVGDYKMDGVNTGSLPGLLTEEDYKNFLYPKLMLDEKKDGIKKVFWKITDFAYKNALKNFYERKKRETAFLEEDTSYSFSKEIPNKYESKEIVKLSYEEIKKMMESFLKKIDIKNFYNFKASFYSIYIERIILNTEGTEIEDSKNYFLLKIEASIFDSENKYYENKREFFGYKISEIFNKEKIVEINEFLSHFKEHVNGEEIREYRGDIILKGISSAKFISSLVRKNLLLSKDNYDILKNFVERVDKKITGNLTIYDNPNLKYFNKTPLSGYLLYDDEGIKTKEVILIENGVLKNFLLKREPVEKFVNSNGHARASFYSKPYPFITNLFVVGEKKENVIKDSILIIEDIEFKTPFSFEIKKGYILYKNNEKKEIKNSLASFSSFEEMWEKIKGVAGNLNSYNFYEENPYLPFSVTSYDLIIEDVYVKRFIKKRIRND